MGATLARKLRGALFQAMLRQDQGYFDLPENGTGSLQERLTKDARHVKGAVADNTAVMLQTIVMFVLAYVLALTAQWKVALVITAVFPVMGMVATFQTQFATGFDLESSKRFAPANATAADAIANAK